MKKYFIELSIVVLGVTIAFVLGNISQNLKSNFKTKRSLNLVLKEVENHEVNLNEITVSQSKILIMYEDSTIFSDTANISIQKMKLSNSAFNFIIYNDVFEDIEFKKATAITEYYSNLEVVKTLEANLFNSLSNLVVHSDSSNLEELVFWVSQLQPAELEMKQLNKELQITLSKN